MIRWRHSDNRG